MRGEENHLELWDFSDDGIGGVSAHGGHKKKITGVVVVYSGKE